MVRHGESISQSPSQDNIRESVLDATDREIDKRQASLEDHIREKAFQMIANMKAFSIWGRFSKI